MPLWNSSRNNYQNNNRMAPGPAPNYGYGPNQYQMGNMGYQNGFNNANIRPQNNNSYPQNRGWRGFSNQANMPQQMLRPQQMPPQQMPPQQMPGPQQMPPQQMPGPQQMPPQQMAGPQQMPPQQMPGPQQIPPQMNQGFGGNQGIPQEQNQGPVSYEPLDEKTLAEVQRIIAEKTGAAPVMEEDAQVPATDQLLLPPVPSKETDSVLVEFIQNERNAGEFYKYLSEIAGKEDHSATLKTLSHESIKRSEAFNHLYKTMYGKECAVKKAKVNNTVRFKEGISWAINVENRALREISDYFEHLENNQHIHRLNAIIYKKICDLSCLQSISNSIRSFF